ncbi:class I SAM-dependent methyltransferase [Acinetobacter higginsii]|uniref:class I SAM-dependent methyltransferase n=1 Tax=Acinetobacter higginsii TaxID=70347 RepID=UPI001F4B7012|nr:class I SAM-dependent methyltransferase [Acinetobacter higginsii]MCH7295160.1 class I SAM-dependent methyltransferase [Acinetobacter higginsii]MCI3878610.1 class I SAM-dependent methyltransferase [Acinetobacter higginsii]
MKQTLDYYDINALEFFESTFKVDMESLYQPFLRYLPDHASILDLGCGSGRDTLAFKNKGYQVAATDYSKELVDKASRLSGVDVCFESFYELSEQDQYDGVWACASLLHCERKRLPEVLEKILKALKLNGICYMSFKYGEEDRYKDGRQFTDMNESQAQSLLKKFDNILLLQQWITIDKRPDHNEDWLNIVFQKQN